MDPLNIFLILLALLIIAILRMAVKRVPQKRAPIVERFGKYRATLPAGLNVIMPFMDKVQYTVDLRERVVSFPPQPVITEDNLVVSIDTVIYFQVIDPVAATYEIANFLDGIEQLTMTTLRNIIGGMTLEHALTSRDQINAALRGELDSATGKWGIRVGRVELKGIDPPATITDAMEKQMRADRDKRAAILTAEGERQSAILMAEGGKQAAILSAEGDRQATILRAQADREASILRAQGEGKAIETVFQSIHDGNPDQKLLAYQYLQMLPRIAEGEASTMWIIPTELTNALESMGGTIGKIPLDGGGSKKRVNLDEKTANEDEANPAATKAAVEAALEAAKDASAPGGGRPGKAQPKPPKEELPKDVPPADE